MSWALGGGAPWSVATRLSGWTAPQVEDGWPTTGIKHLLSQCYGFSPHGWSRLLAYPHIDLIHKVKQQNLSSMCVYVRMCVITRIMKVHVRFVELKLCTCALLEF